MNIRVDLNYPIKDGTEVVFRSPVDCSQVTGLKVYYIGDDGSVTSQEFAFADAHGNNVGNIDHLFAENVAVKVILDVTTGMAFVQNADTNAYLEGRFASLCPSFTESGAVVACEPLEGTPLEVVSGIEPVQTGSGDPSPDNVRPINGHTAVKLTHCGKNWFNPETAIFTIHFRRDGDSFISDNNTAATYVYNLFWLEAGVTYCFSADLFYNAPTDFALTVRSANGKTTYGKIYPTTEGRHSLIFTPTQSDTYRFTVGGTNNDSGMTISRIQLEVGSTATEYEPYRGAEFTMDLGQTVYGGSFNWKTGVLTIGYANLRLDRKLSWANLAGATDVIRPIGLDGDASGIARKNTALCTHFVRGTQDGTVGQFWISPITSTQFNVRFMIPKTIATTQDEWYAYLDANEVMLCHEMAEPITVQLTPQEILALSSTNTLYSDTGDTTVTGKADLATVVAKLQETIKTLLEG